MISCANEEVKMQYDKEPCKRYKEFDPWCSFCAANNIVRGPAPDVSPTSNDLLCCPFCGSHEVEEKESGRGDHWVECLKCEARGPNAYYPEGAWNTRHPR